MAGYGDDAGFAAWLAARGLVLPAGAPTAAIIREIGSAYVDAAYGAALWCSQKTGGFAQELEWPRSNHQINGETVPNSYIPLKWIQASYQAGWLNTTRAGWATGGYDPGRTTKMEKAGEVSREFFAAADAPGSRATMGFNVDPTIEGMVNGLLCPVVCIPFMVV